MDYQDGLKNLVEKISKFKDQITSEEATKTALIMPFFDLLGYDTRNPLEFVPEYTADVGLKKGEKVDYAIVIDGKPAILIEAKACTETLEKHDSQLIRYFHTTQARIGILTNGITYRFYTDLDEPNKMDTRPFFEIDLLNLKDNEVLELKKFFRSSFDMGNILSTAEELKYSNAIKKVFQSQIESPTEQFIDFFIDAVYEGKKTKNVKEKFAPIVQKSVTDALNDLIRAKIENVLTAKSKVEAPVEVEEPGADSESQAGIVTTEEELMGHGIVRSILAEWIDIERVGYKDTINYFNVLIDGKVTKWIVRLYLNSPKNKFIAFPGTDGANREERISIDKIEDLYKYKAKFQQLIEKYLV